MLRLILVSAIFSLGTIGCAQPSTKMNIPENWGLYIADYEGKPGSVAVNLALRDPAIQNAFPFRASFSLPISPCRPDGLSEGNALEIAGKEEDRIMDAISKSGKKFTVAGTFTHNCQRRIYLYLDKDNGLQNELTSLLKKYPASVTDIKVLQESSWSAYSEFLYPNKYNYQQIGNNDVIRQLMQAGDDPSKPRMLEHMLYFKTDEDRTSALAEAIAAKFKLISQEVDKNHDYAYTLEIGFESPLQEVHPQTYYLVDLAEKHNGKYDGWQSEIKR